MRIHSIYLDFFKFLERITPQADKWALYNSLYYQPHQNFFETYLSHFPFINFSNLKERVETIKRPHYSQLKNLITVAPPESIIKKAYKKCKNIVIPVKEPEVYLIVGFFSPEGFIMSLGGKPVICFGLERFKDFRLLKILFAHEYAHYLLNLSRGEVPEGQKYKWLLLSEGLSTYFSQLAFPDYKLSDHFLFQQERLNWCQENESRIRDIFGTKTFSSEKLIELFKKGDPDLNLPPLVGKYLGYIEVKNHIEISKKRILSRLFTDKKFLLKLKI